MSARVKGGKLQRQWLTERVTEIGEGAAGKVVGNRECVEGAAGEEERQAVQWT